MKITLCIDKQDRNNPSSELRQHLIDIGCPLRSYGEFFDELKISTDDTNNLVGVIIRRCYVDKYGVLKKLEAEEIQELEIPEIILFEGANYVYIKEFTNLNMKIEYLTNAEMNKYFATKAEMNSTIKQTYDSILLAVSTKADKTELETAISLLTNGIELRVIKDKIISTINMSPETITILANRLGLTANDVLDIIAGNEINLTSKNISINSTNFKVDKDGNIICASGTFSGNVNTNQNCTVGNDLYVGQNQSSDPTDGKTIYFNEKTFIAREKDYDWDHLVLYGDDVIARGPFKVENDIGYYITNFYVDNDIFDLESNGGGTYLYGDSSGIFSSHQIQRDSDERLKQEIKDIDTSWIDELKVKEYEYKRRPGEKQIGLIAQDYVEKDYAKYFLLKNRDGYYTIGYENITNALIKYCQQLNGRIIELEKQIKEMN